MRRAALLTLLLIGLAFPAGLGLAVYAASGNSLVPPAATARVPGGEIARPSQPPLPTTSTDETTTSDEITTTEETTTTDVETTTESTTTDETTTTGNDGDSGSGQGRGRGRGRSGDD